MPVESSSKSKVKFGVPLFVPSVTILLQATAGLLRSQVPGPRHPGSQGNMTVVFICNSCFRRQLCQDDLREVVLRTEPLPKEMNLLPGACTKLGGLGHTPGTPLV